MKLTESHIIIIGGVALLLIGSVVTFKTRLINRLASFIPSVEGFRSTPYWDVARYSWGYGTKAPGPTGTISREKAFADMLSYLLSDYAVLQPRITRNLSVNQWAALLSFSYNLGTDDAKDIAPVINSGDDSALHTEWMRYVHSGGTRNPALVDRREKEWSLWVS